MRYISDNVEGAEKICFPNKKHVCHGCALGKLHQHSFSENPKHSSETLGLIHSDLLELPTLSYSKCHDLAKRLSHYLYFFPFLFLSLWTYNYKVERGKVSRDFVTMSQWCDGWSQMVTSQVTVTRCHMTRVT